MHYPLVYTLLAIVAGSLVSAQDLSQIPQCAAFLDSLLPQVQEACTADELQRLISATQSLCLASGVTLSIPSAASATSAAASASNAVASATSAAGSASSAVASLVSSLSAAANPSQTPTGAASSPSPSTTITPANSGSQLASAGGLMAAIAVAAAVAGLN
ncbi:MAG: hypothetical protein Q9187_003868 [Circinaria calcarea]